MKFLRILFSFVLFLFGASAVAQEVDYNKIILPGNAVDVSIEERLVQLAWQNNPLNRSIEKQVQVTEYDLRKAKWAWLDYFRATGNLNEFTINPESDTDNRAAFYPRYNFSLTFSLGSLGMNANEVKKRRMEVSIAEDKIKSQKLALRADVLAFYARYVLASEKLKVQTDIEQESYANLRLTEENFKKGIDNVITYNTALERHAGHKLRKLEAEADVKLMKIQIEELIGVKLEAVLNK